MMLFDTDMLIWALRGYDKAADRILKHHSRFISAVSYMELLKGSRDKNEQREIKKFLHYYGFEIIPITENISHRAVIYMEEFAIKSGIDMPIALIAATACETPLPLVTGNYKDYKDIPDIELSIFKPF